MPETVHFTKMHGIGNDYIYVDIRNRKLADLSSLSVKWSDRHRGIGSDGLVLIDNSDKADFSMRIFNADGSEAMMCGNASRCIGKYLYEKKITKKTEISLETLSGIKILKLHISNDGTVESVTIDMGVGGKLNVRRPDGQQTSFVQETVEACEKQFTGTAVDVGNPHLVLFVPDADTIDVARYGSVLEFDPLFPNRANIEFAQVINRKKIRMRVWERGSGITMACGTGACATVVAAALAGFVDRGWCEVVMDGGSLFILCNLKDGHVMMTGPATFVYEGEIKI